MDEGMTLIGDSIVIVSAVSASLNRRGLTVVRSFDLRSALASHRDCVCPYHGTAECNCQYVVLLVYDGAGNAAVLTAHSHDDQTWTQLVQDATVTSDPYLVEVVTAALTKAALALPAVTIVEHKPCFSPDVISSRTEPAWL